MLLCKLSFLGGALAAALSELAYTVNAESGNHDPMIEAKNGWEAIEIVTEGDNPTGKWEIANEMDGVGAFLLNSYLGDEATLRINVNHEDSYEGTISEINLHKGKLKEAIFHKLAASISSNNNNNAAASSSASKYNNKDTFASNDEFASYDFVRSARAAYDRWSPDAGVSWNSIVNATSPSEAGGFCRFCSSQYFEAEAFGPGRGFVDPVYITGEECDDGRLFALDVNTRARDLYQVSGVAGSMVMAPPSSTAGAIENNNNLGIIQKAAAWEATTPEFEAGNGGMPWDSWENTAAIDTNEKDHIALLLSADGGSRKLRLYIGKKFTGANGQVDRFHFLARNGLLYGRYYYLEDFEWAENPTTHIKESKIPGRFVTDEDDGWWGRRFEDVDTNPSNPKQIVLAESTSGVYLLDFDLSFDFDAVRNTHEFNVMKSSFNVSMITDDEYYEYEDPDNVDWTANNLIFVNKDSDEGGVWYMNPDGSGKVQIGHTRSGGESTGILDVSKHLNYPPSSVMITTNQGYPSSMTLLLNPTLKELLLPVLEEINNSVVESTTPETPVPATGGGVSTSPPIVSPVIPAPPAPTARPTAIPTGIPTAKPTPKPTKTPTVAPHFDPAKDCPVNSYLTQVYQAESATLFSGNVKTRSNYYCGGGYVDFVEERNRISGSRGVGGRAEIDSNDNDESTANDVLGISFQVMIDLPGTHRISVRYANGGAQSVKRSAVLLIDEKDTGPDFEFASTFGWDVWAVEKRLVIFDSAGVHSLDLFWTKENKRPNIDWLSIEFVG